MFTKEAYDIDLNTLIPELEKIITTQTLSPNLTIPKEDYISQIHDDANYLKELLGYKNEPYFIVHRTQKAFDFWLALYLSTQKPHLIHLILDRYFNDYHDPGQFVNDVEHTVLRIIDKNIFHDVESQLKEIASWVREKRKTHPQKTEDPFKDGLIASPYGKLLYDALNDFCEASSLSNLNKLLMDQEIDSPVVLKSNFKKISLIRPMKELVARSIMPLNKKGGSIWISDNFEIRTQTGTSKFSLASTQKLMSKIQFERANAQIKYEHWFKK